MESVKALENLTFVVRQWGGALWRLKRVDTRQRRRMERRGMLKRGDTGQEAEGDWNFVACEFRGLYTGRRVTAG